MMEKEPSVELRARGDAAQEDKCASATGSAPRPSVSAMTLFGHCHAAHP